MNISKVDDENHAGGLSTKRSPWLYFVLVFILSVPIWILGPVAQHWAGDAVPINLPFSALQFVCPLIAASILVQREHGWVGVRRLIRRAFDYRSITVKIWYIPIFLGIPVLLVVEYGVMKLRGTPVPDPQFPVWIVPVFFAVFFIPALCEEVGWSGYAIDPLQERWTALGASVIIGIVWAAWHVVPNTQAPHSTLWLVGQFGNTVALRVLIVWIYNNTGKSVFAAIVVHDMVNVSEFLFPVYGSYYDPFIFFLIATITVVIVALVWGPRTLAGLRFARSHESHSKL